MNNEIATKADLVNLSKDISRIISGNNVILTSMMNEKIKANNDILIPLIDKKIKDNNDILIPLIDKKIKDNNEYIFSEFNNQTERILDLFRGVIRVKQDGSFSMNL